MTKTLPLTQVRNELPTIVKNVKKKMDEYIITVKGIPTAIIMSIDEYESWKETQEIKKDRGLMRVIRQGEKEIEEGKFVTLEELEKELNLNV
jgi:prevent-host-death family protein